jgi:hypothetical protein
MVFNIYCLKNNETIDKSTAYFTITIMQYVLTINLSIVFINFKQRTLKTSAVPNTG